METLTKKEEEIMQVLWNIKKAFVKDIIKELPGKKPAYNTVSTVVRLLEKKGFVGHTEYGKTHQYYPLVEKKDYRKKLFGKMLNNYFDDSYKKVVSFLAQEKNLNEDEAAKILKIIEEAEKKAK